MPKAKVPDSLLGKWRGYWLPAAVAIGFLGLNRLLANKDSILRPMFPELFEERAKTDEKGTKTIQEGHLVRMRKQVIEEKLSERKD